MKKNVVETIPVIINDSSNVLCFDLYLIHIIGKSMKAERRIGVMFNLTLNEDIDMKINILDTYYFMVLDSTLGFCPEINKPIPAPVYSIL